MPDDSQWIVLAQVLRPQGRRGEVLADLLTDFPERFADRPKVWLAPAGFADAISPSGAAQSAEVASHWLPVGRNAGRVVLHFAGVDTIEAAEKLIGQEVIVPLAERRPLNSGAAYISDLIGCTVYDHDLPIGTVHSVQFLTTPDGSRRIEEAAPLLEVLSAEGEEVLIPFANAFLMAVDTARKEIRMALPEGLSGINR